MILNAKTISATDIKIIASNSKGCSSFISTIYRLLSQNVKPIKLTARSDSLPAKIAELLAHIQAELRKYLLASYNCNCYDNKVISTV